MFSYPDQSGPTPSRKPENMRSRIKNAQIPNLPFAFSRREQKFAMDSGSNSMKKYGNMTVC
jgi:hypothetical protein